MTVDNGMGRHSSYTLPSPSLLLLVTHCLSKSSSEVFGFLEGLRIKDRPLPQSLLSVSVLLSGSTRKIVVVLERPLLLN